LEFAVDYGFLRAACANIGMRQMRQAHRVIAALDRRSNDASAFILDNVILLRVRLAIAVGDVARALTLLDRQFAGGNRPAFRAEVRAYRSILLAAQGRTDDALAQLESDERSLWFAEADALRSVSRAIMALESGLSTASRDALVAAVLTGCGDSVVTGMRAYPELARWLAADKELRAPLRDLLFRSRDFDIARSAGLKMPRETRPRQRLSPREQDVYDLLAEGRANREIAKALFISESTTKVHVRHIFEKLGVHTRAEAARLASSDEEPTL
jgi:DNA-binding NarL/FixJ family response regulator